MTLTRRTLAIAATAALASLSLIGTAAAEAADETAVNAAVEGLRKAMIAADRAGLESLVADQLSYGHSSGVVETKAQFVDVIASKKTVYKTITLSEQRTAIVGNDAIVRHIFSAEVDAGGRALTPRIGVLQVWQKQDGRWKLLARQAFTLPS